MSHIAQWYRDAKLGIMIHWGLPSVPAFAPVGKGTFAEILRDNDWEYAFRNFPYSEWYQNSLRLGAEETRAYHNKKFNRQYRYERTADRFNDDISKWNPSEWAELFAETGARYVVLVAKHHDGFLMWPSEHKPAHENYTASRDVVGELGEAVRERGLRYGLYYSGLLDWTVQPDPISDAVDLALVSTDAAYTNYARKHYEELIRKYKPDVLWNDIGIPPDFPLRDLFRLYRSEVPEGVINDRWRRTPEIYRKLLALRAVRKLANNVARKAVANGAASGGRFAPGDFLTMEYAPDFAYRSRPWEATRSIGNSYALNLAEPESNYLTGDDLACLLADVVSKNGNLLLNVGPGPDGLIPAAQRKPLLDLAIWLRDAGEAIFDTRPWRSSANKSAEAETSEGQPVRYTAGAGALYAILLESPRRLTILLPGLTERSAPALDLGVESELTVSLLGWPDPVGWRFTDRGLEVRIPGGFVPPGPVVVALKWREDKPEPEKIELYTDVIM